MTNALKLDMDTVKKLAEGTHKELIVQTLPGGRFDSKPCDASCMDCKDHCIDEKYM